MMIRPGPATIPFLALLLTLPATHAPAQKRNIGGPADYYLRENLARQFAGDPELRSAQLTVILVNGGVVLSGSVPSCNLRLRALSTAASLLGVINVTDQMTVVSHERTDEELRAEVLEVLKPQLAILEIENLEVRVENAVATLLGTCKNFYTRIKAEELAGTVFGITDIVNRLQPANAPSGSDDDSIAEALVNYLGDRREFGYSAEITVAVEEGRVTLEGRVRVQLAARQAVMLARLVGGVKEVESLLRVDPSLPVRRGRVKRKE